MLTCPNSFWCRLLSSRYDEVSLAQPQISQGGWRKFLSWWRDIWKACESAKGDHINWFNEGMRRIVRKGEKTKSWDDPWVGDKILSCEFSRLFTISNFKDAMICDVRAFENRRWV
jgi:hypothetical protein